MTCRSRTGYYAGALVLVSWLVATVASAQTPSDAPAGCKKPWTLEVDLEADRVFLERFDSLGVPYFIRTVDGSIPPGLAHAGQTSMRTVRGALLLVQYAELEAPSRRLQELLRREHGLKHDLDLINADIEGIQRREAEHMENVGQWDTQRKKVVADATNENTTRMQQRIRALNNVARDSLQDAYGRCLEEIAAYKKNLEAGVATITTWSAALNAGLNVQINLNELQKPGAPVGTWTSQTLDMPQCKAAVDLVNSNRNLLVELANQAQTIVKDVTREGEPLIKRRQQLLANAKDLDERHSKAGERARHVSGDLDSAGRDVKTVFEKLQMMAAAIKAVDLLGREFGDPGGAGRAADEQLAHRILKESALAKPTPGRFRLYLFTIPHCAPCAQLVKQLARIQELSHQLDVQVIYFGAEPKPDDDAREDMRKYESLGPVYYDHEGASSLWFRIWSEVSAPRTILVGPDGAGDVMFGLTGDVANVYAGRIRSRLLQCVVCSPVPLCGPNKRGGGKGRGAGHQNDRRSAGSSAAEDREEVAP